MTIPMIVLIGLCLCAVLLGYLFGSSVGKKKLRTQISEAEGSSKVLSDKNKNLEQQLLDADAALQTERMSAKQNADEAQQAREDYANAITKNKMLEDQVKNAEERPKVDDAEVSRQIDAANKANADLAEQVALNDKMAERMAGMDSELKKAVEKIKSLEKTEVSQMVKKLSLFEARWDQTSGNWRKIINGKVKKAASS